VRWISADIARAPARHLYALIAASAVFAVAGGAIPEPAHAATTLLINPFAHAASPEGLAVDPAGNVYIADATDNDVVKVTPNGTATVLASGLSAPNGVAVDPTTGDVYVADTGNHEVDRLGAGGALTVVAGTGTAGTPTAGPATASELGGPSGLAVDSAGNLYIADGAGAGGNPLVEEVTPGGTLSILAGSGTRGTPVNGTATHSALRTPTGVAADSVGNVFIADPGAHVVLKVTPTGALTIFAGRPGLSGQPSQTTATSTRLNGPTGVAIDAAGNLYIADAVDNRVVQVTPSDRLSYFAGTGVSGAPVYGAVATLSPLSGPTAVAVAGNGLSYVANAGHATVDRIAPALPALSAAPMPTGKVTQGEALTATAGAWANAPSSYAYGWERCDATGAACAAIPGASGSTYTLTGDDAGATLRSLVTATNVSGATTVASSPTAPVIPLPPANTAVPGIAGTATNLQTLAASPGSWTNHPTKLAYKWEDCDATGGGCTAIAGATTSTYTLAYSDVGATVRVVVSATNAGGSATATSAPTAAIAPVLVPWADTAVPRPLAAPSVSGPAAVGGTLTCATGRWSNSPTGYEYRWARGNAPIPNATGPTYTVTAADRGQQLSCTVTAVNAGGAIQADSARITIPGPAPAHRARKSRKAHKATAHGKPRRAQHRRALTRRRKGGQAGADERRRPSHGPRHPRTREKR
jgi:DNA-binding beta-propeller fold protein YncE